MPDTLGSLARLIRSKNAGAFWLTIDIMFADDETYRRVRDAGVVTVERMSDVFRAPAPQTLVVASDSARAIKVSFPRRRASGSPYDTDVYGGQQYIPLLEIGVP
jgi:Domain of unknown function (DUF4387)